MLNHDELERLADKLYDRYVLPLEAAHWGKFVAVSGDGGIVLGSSIGEVTDLATTTLGKGHFVFRVGPRAVG